MAKVSGPLHSSEARGGVGGVVFNSYRGMSVVKAKTAPAQSNTPKQLQRRAQTTAISRLWKSLLTKAAWDAYAIAHPHADGLGSSVRSSGANWFTLVNTQLLRAGQPFRALPPSAPAPAALANFYVALWDGDITVYFDPEPPATCRIEIWLQGPVSPGRQPHLPSAHFHFLSPDPTFPVPLFTPSRGYFWVFARVLDLASGLVSPWLSAAVDVP